MNEKIRELLIRISSLEDEVEVLLREQQNQALHYLEDGKIRIKREVDEAHKLLKKGVIRWLIDSRPRNIVSAPFIYTMIIPFVFLDFCLSIYQWICFPLCKIGNVKEK